MNLPKLGRSSASFTLTETEQALRVEVRDLLLVICVDGHLIDELRVSSHATTAPLRNWSVLIFLPVYSVGTWSPRVRVNAALLCVNETKVWANSEKIVLEVAASVS